MRQGRGPALPASAACLAPRQPRQGSRGQMPGRVSRRQGGAIAMPAGAPQRAAKPPINTLEQDRAETCRREQAPLARDARCPERGQRRCRRERDDRDGDDAMARTRRGVPTPAEAASFRCKAANRCHTRIRPGANEPGSRWRSAREWRGPWRARTGTTESSGAVRNIGAPVGAGIQGRPVGTSGFR